MKRHDKHIKLFENILRLKKEHSAILANLKTTKSDSTHYSKISSYSIVLFDLGFEIATLIKNGLYTSIEMIGRGFIECYINTRSLIEAIYDNEEYLREIKYVIAQDIYQTRMIVSKLKLDKDIEDYDEFCNEYLNNIENAIEYAFPEFLNDINSNGNYFESVYSVSKKIIKKYPKRDIYLGFKEALGKCEDNIGLAQKECYAGGVLYRFLCQAVHLNYSFIHRTVENNNPVEGIVKIVTYCLTDILKLLKDNAHILSK